MSKYQYTEINFKPESLQLIDFINTIVEDYIEQGFKLTVRQLYYQLVARDVIANTERSYKRITGLVNDGRLAGLIDWEAIEDRTRDFIKRPHWESGSHFLRSAAPQFYMDMWETQHRRVFVIVEKEALVGVLEGLCREYDVPIMPARGYPSVSVLREFAVGDLDQSQDPLVLHLGDHDPSGLDMTRDLEDRLALLLQSDNFELKRIALNRDQIDALKPPPNPAKTTDSRFTEYRRKHGSSSWELDALSPKYLNDLVRSHITAQIETAPWSERQEEIADTRAKLSNLAEKFK